MQEPGACGNLEKEFDVSGSCLRLVLEVQGAVMAEPASAQAAAVPHARGWRQGRR